MRLTLLLFALSTSLLASPTDEIEKISQCTSWLHTQNTSIRQIQSLSRDSKKLHKIFHTISTLSHFIDKPCQVAESPQNAAKNRYKNMLPFDETLTCRDMPDFYVNASDVFANEQYYILCQAPTSSTVEDFWFTLLTKGSPLIITLAMPFENGCEKCFPYWEEKALPITVCGFRIERISQDEVLYSNSAGSIVRRLFFCTSVSQAAPKIITQLHYENWPDNGAPALDILRRLLQEMDTLELSKETPITVHCSAGVGRTGTFVAIHALSHKIAEAKSEGLSCDDFILNIPEEILKLRSQRRGLVATPAQLQAIYQALQ
jgi:protein tyrosine phosphatase